MATAPPAPHIEHDEEEWRTDRKWARQPDWIYVTPILIGASIPLSRLALRKHPTWRNRAFVLTVGLGVIHGAWLIARANQTDSAGIPSISRKKPTAPANS